MSNSDSRGWDAQYTVIDFDIPRANTHNKLHQGPSPVKMQSEHIMVDIKWPPFLSRLFQMRFLD